MVLRVARGAFVYVVVLVIVVAIVIAVDFKPQLNSTNSTYRLTSFNTKAAMNFVLRPPKPTPLLLTPHDDRCCFVVVASRCCCCCCYLCCLGRLRVSVRSVVLQAAPRGPLLILILCRYRWQYHTSIKNLLDPSQNDDSHHISSQLSSLQLPSSMKHIM